MSVTIWIKTKPSISYSGKKQEIHNTFVVDQVKHITLNSQNQIYNTTQ